MPATPCETRPIPFSRSRRRVYLYQLLPCSTLLLLSLFLAPTAQATILLFDQMRSVGAIVPTISGNDVPQDYGDRVTGTTQSVADGTFTYGQAGEGFTPNIVVEYLSTSATGGNDVSLWQDNYGDLTNIIFGNQNSNTLGVRLTADAGYSAVLHGFDLAGYSNADYTIAAVRVLAGPTELFAQSNVLVEGDFMGPRHTTFKFDPALSAAELHLEIDYRNLAAGQRDNIGLDNLRFSQDPPGIPEPATHLLAILAAAIFLAFRVRTDVRARGGVARDTLFRYGAARPLHRLNDIMACREFVGPRHASL